MPRPQIGYCHVVFTTAQRRIQKHFNFIETDKQRRLSRNTLPKPKLKIDAAGQILMTVGQRVGGGEESHARQANTKRKKTLSRNLANEHNQWSKVLDNIVKV